MTLTDIIINREISYDVCVGEANCYDIKIPSEPKSLDIVVSGLLSQYDIYGDEFVPLVMYLKTNAEMVPYIILLNKERTTTSLDNKYLNDLDGMLLNDVDIMGAQSEQAISLSLKSRCDGFENSTVISIEHQEMSMLTSADELTLNTYINTMLHNMGLVCEADVIAVSYISSAGRNGFSLKSYVDENALITVFLKSTDRSLMSFDDMRLTELDNMPINDMDIILSRTRLLQSELPVNMQLSIDTEVNDLPLIHEISNMIFSTYITIVGRNISHLSTDAYLDRTIFLSKVTEDWQLSCTERIATYVSFYLYPENIQTQIKTGMDFEYPLMNYDTYSLNGKMDSILLNELDNADDIIHLETFCQSQSCATLNTSASMVTEPSANYYGDYLLTSIDDYTILELEAELGTKIQNTEQAMADY